MAGHFLIDIIFTEHDKTFPNDGIDSFENMAKKGLMVTNRVVLEELGGKIDEENNIWIIPLKQ